MRLAGEELMIWVRRGCFAADLSSRRTRTRCVIRLLRPRQMGRIITAIVAVVADLLAAPEIIRVTLQYLNASHDRWIREATSKRTAPVPFLDPKLVEYLDQLRAAARIQLGPFYIERSRFLIDLDLGAVERSDRGVAAHEFRFIGGQPLSVCGHGTALPHHPGTLIGAFRC